VQNCSAVAVFYDADAAGDAGYEKLRKRQRLFMPVLRIRPPDGLDPKDMRIDSIRELIRSTLQLAYSPM
jgi:DNA primase